MGPLASSDPCKDSGSSQSHARSRMAASESAATMVMLALDRWGANGKDQDGLVVWRHGTQYYSAS